jgi:hypothetical protein
MAQGIPLSEIDGWNIFKTLLFNSLRRLLLLGNFISREIRPKLLN